MTSAGRRILALAALAVVFVLLTGCTASGSEQRVELLRVGAPLQEPVWVPGKKVLLALNEDRRLVRVNVAESKPGARRSRSWRTCPVRNLAGSRRWTRTVCG